MYADERPPSLLVKRRIEPSVLALGTVFAIGAHVLIPTLIAHGTKDTVTLISSGRKLYDSLPASIEKHWIEIPAAGHDNVLITDFPIYATIAEWMIRHVIQP